MRRNKEEESRQKEENGRKMRITYILNENISKLFLIHNIISRPFVCTSSEGSGDT